MQTISIVPSNLRVMLKIDTPLAGASFGNLESLGFDPQNLFHLMRGSGPWRGPDLKRPKVTEEQIIAILREQEAGAKRAEVGRRHGISGATFYA